jgi:hypothetical protein
MKRVCHHCVGDSGASMKTIFAVLAMGTLCFAQHSSTRELRELVTAVRALRLRTPCLIALALPCYTVQRTMKYLACVLASVLYIGCSAIRDIQQPVQPAVPELFPSYKYPSPEPKVRRERVGDFDAFPT